MMTASISELWEGLLDGRGSRGKLLCSMDMLNDAIKSQGGLLSERGLCRGQGKHWSYSHHITTTGNAQRKRLGSSGIVATIRTRPTTGVSRMEELTPKPRQRGKSLSSDFSTSIWIHVLISRPNA